MKKGIIGFLIFMIILAGCSQPKNQEVEAKPDNQNEGKDQATDKKDDNPITKPETVSYDLKSGMDFALEHYQVKEATFTSVKLKDKGGIQYYDIELAIDDYEYDLEFDINDTILKDKREVMDAEDKAELSYEGFGISDLNSIISTAEAREIAQAQVEGTPHSIKLKRKSYGFVYDVEINDFDIRINASDGSIIEIDD